MTPGRKDDDGKPRVELVPPCFIRATARALADGAREYVDADGPNYLKVKDGERRYYAAAMRHLMAFHEGEGADEKSGLHPLDHAAANIAILIHRAHECPSTTEKNNQ